MNKSFWLYLILLTTPTTLLAGKYKGEKLYPLEVFSKEEKDGYILLASGYATWKDLAKAMQDQFQITLEKKFTVRHCRFFFKKTRNVNPKDVDKKFLHLLGDITSYWTFPSHFDTLDYQGVLVNSDYKLALKLVPELHRIPESEKHKRSIFAKRGNAFELMSIDEYHQVRQDMNRQKIKNRKKTPFIKASNRRTNTMFSEQIRENMQRITQTLTEQQLKSNLNTEIFIQDEEIPNEDNNTNTDNDGKEDSHGETYSDNEDNNNNDSDSDSDSDSHNNSNNDNKNNNNNNNNENNDNTPPTNFLSKETQIGIAVVIIPAGIILQNVFFTHLKKQPKKTRPKKHTDTTDQSI